jgi:uncharacterized protein YbjT (DUF2867 family)
MKIVVIGGTGLIGSKTVAILHQSGHEVVAASPNTGVNTITGEGLKEAMAGAQVVIDLVNSPSLKTKRCWSSSKPPAATFSRRRPQRASSTMSRYPSSESTGPTMAIFAPSGIPYTIIRSTQFLEFLRGIVDSSADGNRVRISPGLFQPIAADDVAANVADVALAAPRNGIVEIAGPERAPFNEMVARYLKAVGDPREVVRDPEAREPRGATPSGSIEHVG